LAVLFEHRVSSLPGRWSTTWATFLVICFNYFSDKVTYFCPALASDFHPSAYDLLCSWIHRHMQPCSAFPLRWGLANFNFAQLNLELWPFPFSCTSWVAWITGVNHQAWLPPYFRQWACHQFIMTYKLQPFH
jgi:hypothetical protein